MWPFKCRHPFSSLWVHSSPKEESRDEDFIVNSITMYCSNCGERLTRKWADLVGGVDGFLDRDRSADKQKKGRKV